MLSIKCDLRKLKKCLNTLFKIVVEINFKWGNVGLTSAEKDLCPLYKQKCNMALMYYATLSGGTIVICLLVGCDFYFCLTSEILSF